VNYPTEHAENAKGTWQINYDPMLGTGVLAKTMPLPKKNNLLESNRQDGNLETKEFL
jgi:hypothetical protein